MTLVLIGVEPNILYMTGKVSATDIYYVPTQLPISHRIERIKSIHASFYCLFVLTGTFQYTAYYL